MNPVLQSWSLTVMAWMGFAMLILFAAEVFMRSVVMTYRSIKELFKP